MGCLNMNSTELTDVTSVNIHNGNNAVNSISKFNTRSTRRSTDANDCVGYTGLNLVIESATPEQLQMTVSVPTSTTATDRINTYIAGMMRMTTEAVTLSIDSGITHEKIDTLLATHSKELLPRSTVNPPLIIKRANKPDDLQFMLTYISGQQNYDLLPVGGIGAIIASPGNGKSSTIGAIAAALENPLCDSWGFHLNCHKKMVIIDTEQDPVTLWRTVDRMCIRAQILELNRVTVAGVVNMTLSEKVNYVLSMIQDPEYDLVVIDGIGDLVLDVNSPRESSELVHQICSLAAQNKTSVIVTLHDNPVQSKSTFYGKSRGHLGSEITRRADFSLYVRYDQTDQIYRLTADAVSGKCRHCRNDLEIFFKWNDSLKMHVSVDAQAMIESSNQKEIKYVKALLDIREQWTTEQLREHLAQTEKIGGEAAKKRIAIWKNNNILLPLKRGVYVVNGALISNVINVD